MECHKCPESASCPNGGPPLFGTAFTTEIQISGVSSSMILDPANVELHDIIVAAYAAAAGARNPNDYESSQPPPPGGEDPQSHLKSVHVPNHNSSTEPTLVR